MPRAGRGGFGRGGAASPTAPYATLTLPSGETIKGAPVRVTDFDVTLRLADGIDENLGPKPRRFPKSRSPIRFRRTSIS